ncbi:diguanylate cyclase [Rhodoferax sp.]|uniref:sensor domain-containing diguanylate cyclase n=1 Tax=Rhodoferax sp. TaxID=50421 RepID=UPI00261B318A|nr:diguanylate cyclase [Rhodoferax sp.]MDD2920135.1 diguanylate cyclase [Rhodoferax sp.]
MVFRKNPPDPAALRQLAIARLSGRSRQPDAAAMDLPQVQHLLEELEIHQIELELQNEHLNTARAQLEQALNQSNELYDFSPVGSVMINTDGVIARLNLSGAQMLGSERLHLMGSTFGLYVAEPQRAQFNAMLERARAEREAQTAELMLQIDGLAPLPVQVKVVWIGAAVGWQVALIDVSERRRMEAQLRASEERLTLALSAVGDWVWDWQVSRDEVTISEGFAQMVGVSGADLGRTASEVMRFIHPDDKPKLLKKLQNCINGISERYVIEYRVVCPDGNSKWLLARGAVVLRSEDGKALRLVGTLVEVSNRKQIEAELSAAAQFQQAVFDSISAQIAVLDQTGTIVQTNAAWSDYASRFHFEKSVGRNYLTLLADQFVMAPATVEAVAAGMAQIVAGETLFFHHLEPIQCQCHECWFTLKITPVHDAARRLVVTHEDVSVLKQAELASLALANVDALTGAFSRHHFLKLAEQELMRSVRYALPLVALMLDLDHFKQINDSYGHSAGDAVLKGFVQTVKSVLRESDVIGRIGGEEFAVLLPNTTQQGGVALAHRILESVRSSSVDICGLRIPYTVSVGAGCLTNQKSFAELLGQCDTALYRAKHGGRDRLELSWQDSPGQRNGGEPRLATA